jgi:hypothetical protein
MPRKKTKEEFIAEAIKKHGTKFNYDKVVYKNSTTKITIICPEHGEFEQKPYDHISSKNGCAKCGGRYSYSTEEWVEKASKKHNDKYDYSKVKYEKCSTKINIICSEHGEFKQTPECHLSGQGCPKCSNKLNGLKKMIYTTKTWIEKAEQIHGNKYQYSLSEYKGSRYKIKILCPKEEHGEFLQGASYHINQKGNCPKCNIDKPRIYTPKTFTTEQFITKSKLIHGDKYNYEKSVYKNSSTKVIINCSVEGHGDFLQSPKKHYQGGCMKCGGCYSPTAKEWITLAQKVHGLKYNYEKTNYINTHTKVIINCPVKDHGDFMSIPSDHIYNKSGCRECGYSNAAKNNRLSKQSFISEAKKIHDNKYNYDKIEKYVNRATKINIECKIHGIFKQTPNGHLSGKGCLKCGGLYSPTTMEWIAKAIEVHGEKYNYDKVDYVNSATPVIIICPIEHHGEFSQTPASHLTGSNCSKCCGRYSPTTIEWIEKAKSKYGERYNYDKVEYVKMQQDVVIICVKHSKEFKQAPSNHMIGKNGCSACRKIKKITSHTKSKKKFVEDSVKTHGNLYNYDKVKYTSCKHVVDIECKKHGIFKRTPDYHINGRGGCPKCNLCPKCELWSTSGELCTYCRPQTSENKLYMKTKEIQVVKYLREHLPDDYFSHNESIGSICTKNDRINTNGHIFPDIRYDCEFYQLIIEVDEHKHTGSGYECDNRRMYDIIAKLGMPCVFIRYNPDSKKSDLKELLNLTKKYLKLKIEDPQIWNEYGFKSDYLFYE